jgi:DNA-binding transcriptional regulator YiaG
MTRVEFHERLNAIGLTCSDFAAIASYNPDTVRDWGRRYAIPYQARLLLYLLEERGSVTDLLGRSHRQPSPQETAR